MPAMRENTPALRRCVQTRSMRYGCSPTSSRRRMAPFISGSHRVPSSVATTVRSPPSSGPSTTPGTSGLPWSGSGTRPSSRANSRSETQGGWSASWVTTGPWMEIRPVAWSAQWRATLSEKPTSGLSGSRPKSMRGRSRAAPEPPRAQTTARLPGSENASTSAAVRTSSLPARYQRFSNRLGDGASSYRSASRVMPRSKRSRSKGEDGATTATRSPGRRRGERTIERERTTRPRRRAAAGPRACLPG